MKVSNIFGEGEIRKFLANSFFIFPVRYEGRVDGKG